MNRNVERIPRPKYDLPAQKTLLLSPLASVSEPDDLLCRRGYFLAAAFAAPCWLRVTLRPDAKMDAATAADSAAESRPSSGPTGAGEILRTELGLSRRGEERLFYDVHTNTLIKDYNFMHLPLKDLERHFLTKLLF